MATTPTRKKWTVDDLLTGIKQLPPADLREFQREFAGWSVGSAEIDGPSFPARDEAELLAIVRENSALPAAEQRRFEKLRRKRQAGRLAESEEKQLQALWCRVEQMNAMRLEALAKLARWRGTDVAALMHQLGLDKSRDTF